jgi:hypothetical protein
MEETRGKIRVYHHPSGAMQVVDINEIRAERIVPRLGEAILDVCYDVDKSVNEILGATHMSFVGGSDLDLQTISGAVAYALRNE